LIKDYKTETGGFIFPLNGHIYLNNLKVILSTETIVATNKFWAWRMAHPSRGISLSVRYPSELSINRELFGIGEECNEIDDKGKGYYKLSSKKWILPDEGIVFELV
jgi:hypothetical protein